MAKPKKMLLTRKLSDGWEHENEVVVMAIVGKYAMVRIPGCMPFVCQTKELSESP